ncbi:unnamed protein product [Vitrella brassicaformis CCMP3155]|uniref:Uncharacterized protein n=1 Tax=Vitrella brassicaformis (strain CCMP3155) TaxID=1169540 RepID=A0A0G4EF31_VITBC|nr:unnamed protein product [Vitrella brassicaformis CCMP3155]|eukprot:CEL94020.1 unnamed protein product [Vitrella brassicaformis CCMP3155]
MGSLTFWEHPLEAWIIPVAGAAVFLVVSVALLWTLCCRSTAMKQRARELGEAKADVQRLEAIIQVMEETHIDEGEERDTTLHHEPEIRRSWWQHSTFGGDAQDHKFTHDRWKEEKRFETIEEDHPEPHGERETAHAKHVTAVMPTAGMLQHEPSHGATQSPDLKVDTIEAVAVAKRPKPSLSFHHQSTVDTQAFGGGLEDSAALKELLVVKEQLSLQGKELESLQKLDQLLDENAAIKESLEELPAEPLDETLHQPAAVDRWWDDESDTAVKETRWWWDDQRWSGETDGFELPFRLKA